MNLDELLLNIRDVSFSSAVCQTDIRTRDDIADLRRQSYNISLTLDEFKDKFPAVDPARIYYIPSLSVDCFYFNEDTLASCPFRVDLMLAGFGDFSPEGVSKAIAKREADVADGNYLGSITTFPDRMQLEYFTRLVNKKGSEIDNLYELFFEVYTNSDYGFNGLDASTLRTILASKTDSDKERTRKALNGFPETITIYRGGNSASAGWREAFSWTLDINVANFFACRRGKGLGYIAQAEVSKADIIDVFLDERREQEVIVDPATVRFVHEIPIHSLELLKDILPKVSPIYRGYLDAMNHLRFVQNSDIHGKAHQARVLLLTQIISEMMDLPLYERKLLATAAIYHDTQRKHDGEDEEHGEAARAYYWRTSEEPHYLVEFLCKYHCLPDEMGYAAIENNKKLQRNKSLATRLFQVFKDADALDRIRLGSIKNDLDLNQLRLDISKELTLVARICLEQVKV